jgi:hypothetical protein
MSEKPDLKKLHYERLKRELKTYADKSVGPDEFSCAVCYTDGKDSGLVTPACCSHKICLACYTKIVSLQKEQATCPECRTLYIPKPVDASAGAGGAVGAVGAVAAAAAAGAESDIYYGMPPLINAWEVDLININTNINYNIIPNPDVINTILHTQPLHYDLINAILVQMSTPHTTD